MKSKIIWLKWPQGEKKLMMMLIVALLTTSSTAIADETILKKDQKAPFSGVLVSEKNYRKYVANEFELKDVKEDNIMLSRQVDGLMQREVESERHEPNYFTWLLAGFAVGIATSMAVK